MKKWQNIFCLFGRIFISLLFILSAVNKMIEWQQTERGLTNLLHDWQSYVTSLSIQNFFSFLLDWVPAILVILMVIELLGGLLVFFGVKVRFGAVLLILFLIPTTILFHHFWFLKGLKRETHLILFLKNIAIMGGLFYVLAFGGKQKEEKKPLPGPLPPPRPMPPPNQPKINRDPLK